MDGNGLEFSELYLVQGNIIKCSKNIRHTDFDVFLNNTCTILQLGEMIFL